MAGETEYSIDPVMEQEIMNEVEDQQMDHTEDSFDENQLLNQEYQGEYPVPEPEERINAAAFLNKAAFHSKDTVRTTFLHEGELGRPLFTVRFLMDMEDISNYYIDPLLKKYKEKLDEDTFNKISNYFWNKLQNITDSGMSNKGFISNLSVTRKMDATRTRTREPPQIQGKGGIKR